MGTLDRWSRRSQRRLDEVGRQYLEGRWPRTRRVPVWVNVALAALGGAGTYLVGVVLFDEEFRWGGLAIYAAVFIALWVLLPRLGSLALDKLGVASRE